MDRILPESPADKVGIDIRKGDELVAVDGVRVDTEKNREMYFTSPVSRPELKLTFKHGGKEYDVKVHTSSLTSIKALMYQEWENERKSIVETKGGGRIGYIHMRGAGEENG